MGKVFKVRNGKSKDKPTKDIAKLKRMLQQIEKDINKLEARKSRIKMLIGAEGNTTGFTYRETKTPIKLYVLKLESNKYYVGQTTDIDKRFKSHQRGNGAIWTRIHKPISILKTIETDLTSQSEVAKMEDELTLDTAKEYGTDNVRGGGYCQMYPRWPDSLYHLG